jgi:BMFP domain-containing protein YqiC
LNLEIFDDIMNLLNNLFFGGEKMEKEILKILMDIQKDNKEFRNEINTKLDNITNKLDAVYEQTANLTEFRTEVNDKLDTIKNDLNTVEVVTSKNWNDIAKLKAVK